MWGSSTFVQATAPSLPKAIIEVWRSLSVSFSLLMTMMPMPLVAGEADIWPASWYLQVTVPSSLSMAQRPDLLPTTTRGLIRVGEEPVGPMETFHSSLPSMSKAWRYPSVATKPG